MRLFDLFRKPEFEPMPERFEALVVYNDEVARGLVHTGEYRARMVQLQWEFDAWQRDAWERAGYQIHDLGGGATGLLKVPHDPGKHERDV